MTEDAANTVRDRESVADLTGFWEGRIVCSSCGAEDYWRLRIYQNSSAITGTLFVTLIRSEATDDDGDRLTIVEQPILGQLRGRILDFHATSVTFLQKANVQEYWPDDYSGTIAEDHCSVHGVPRDDRGYYDAHNFGTLTLRKVLCDKRSGCQLEAVASPVLPTEGELPVCQYTRTYLGRFIQGNRSREYVLLYEEVFEVPLPELKPGMIIKACIGSKALVRYGVDFVKYGTSALFGAVIGTAQKAVTSHRPRGFPIKKRDVIVRRISPNLWFLGPHVPLLVSSARHWSLGEKEGQQPRTLVVGEMNTFRYPRIRDLELARTDPCFQEQCPVKPPFVYFLNIPVANGAVAESLERGLEMRRHTDTSRG